MLLAVILFGAPRDDNLLPASNVLLVLRYSAMFAPVALGMCFVIMTGGIDLSVGSTAALGSVATALASPWGWAAGMAAGVGAGLVVGAINEVTITRLHIMPFIATLVTVLAASGSAILLSGQQCIPISTETAFMWIGQGICLGLPIPVWIAAAP